MANIRLSAGTRNAMVTAATSRVDGGTVKVYTGTAPADPDTAATGTLLATFTLPSPAFGTPTTGQATIGTIASVTAAATGTAGWCRFANSTGTAQFDGDVATSGALLNLNTTSITSGGTVSITGGSITMPGA